MPLPLYPAQSVASVKVYATDGTPITIAASDYLVDTASRPGQVVPNGVRWPAPGKAAGGIEIAFTAGYGAAAADAGADPPGAAAARRALVRAPRPHRDRNGRDDHPAAVSELLKPYRMRRL